MGKYRNEKRARLFFRGLVVLALSWACMGLSCDAAAASTFRSTATSAIGEGVRTIMNGILDGLIAAVEQAGDGN